MASLAKFLCCHLLATWLVLVTSSSFRYHSDQHIDTGNEELRCGGVFNVSIGELHGIAYHEFDLFGNNERCIWTIRAEQAARFRVEIIYLGFPESNDNHRLVVTGVYNDFRTRSEEHGDLKHYQTDPPTDPPTDPTTEAPTDAPTTETPREAMNHVVIDSESTFDVIGYVVLVTFQTGSTNPSRYRGFILTITPIESMGVPVSSQSRDYIMSSNAGAVKHPVSGNYAVNDVSTFVFTPSNNSMEDGGGGRMDIFFVNNGLYTGCQDYVAVYMYDLKSFLAHKWEYVGDICDPVPVELISSSDLVLFVFRSDRKTPNGPGFQLSYTRCVEFLS